MARDCIYTHFKTYLHDKSCVLPNKRPTGLKLGPPTHDSITSQSGLRLLKAPKLATESHIVVWHIDAPTLCNDVEV